MVFEDMAAYFTWKEWRKLDPSQRGFFWEVMQENYSYFAGVGKEVPV